MSNHITINGRTFASVEEMPPEIRRQYESAMQLLAKSCGGSASTPDSDVNISTQDSDPAHPAFTSVAQMTTSRIIVNGKEYHNMEDVPAEARAVFQDAARSAGAQALIAQSSHTTNVSRTPDWRTPHDPTFDSSTGITFDSSTGVITMGLRALIVLLLIALLAGVFIGLVAGLFIGAKPH